MKEAFAMQKLLILFLKNGIFLPMMCLKSQRVVNINHPTPESLCPFVYAYLLAAPVYAKLEEENVSDMSPRL